MLYLDGVSEAADRLLSDEVRKLTTMPSKPDIAPISPAPLAVSLRSLADVMETLACAAGDPDDDLRRDMVWLIRESLDRREARDSARTCGAESPDA